MLGLGTITLFISTTLSVIETKNKSHHGHHDDHRGPMSKLDEHRLSHTGASSMQLIGPEWSFWS
jgi:hypothetical protein